MKIDDIRHLKNIRAKFFLKNNIFYTGTIIEIREDNFIILDKFDHKVLITIEIVERVEEIG